MKKKYKDYAKDAIIYISPIFALISLVGIMFVVSPGNPELYNKPCEEASLQPYYKIEKTMNIYHISAVGYTEEQVSKQIKNAIFSIEEPIKDIRLTGIRKDGKIWWKCSLYGGLRAYIYKIEAYVVT